jgi:hypothetical protein
MRPWPAGTRPRRRARQTQGGAGSDPRRPTPGSHPTGAVEGAPKFRSVPFGGRGEPEWPILATPSGQLRGVPRVGESAVATRGEGPGGSTVSLRLRGATTGGAATAHLQDQQLSVGAPVRLGSIARRPPASAMKSRPARTARRPERGTTDRGLVAERQASRARLGTRPGRCWQRPTLPGWPYGRRVADGGGIARMRLMCRAATTCVGPAARAREPARGAYWWLAKGRWPLARLCPNPLPSFVTVTDEVSCAVGELQA